MKKFLLRLSLFFFLFLFAFFSFSSLSAGKGERRETKRAETQNCDACYESVLSFERGYVYGQGVLSEVYLLGSYHNKGLYADDLRIEIRSLEGELVQEFKPQVRGGFAPRLALLPFLGNGVSQIYLAADSGGSGAFAYYNIYSVADKNEKLLFSNEKMDERFRYEAEFANGYRLAVSEMSGKRTFVIDLRNKDKTYLSQIYDESGNVKKECKGNVSGLNALFPFYNAPENRFDLIAYQRVTGLYGADAYGYVANHLRFLPSGEFESYFEMLGII